MNIQISEKNRKGAFLVLTPVVALTYITLAIYLQRNNIDTSSDASIQDKVVGIAPTLFLVPPDEVSRGGRYYFSPRFSDPDSSVSAIKMEIVEAPDWLAINSDYSLEGVVPESLDPDIKSDRVILSISDGSNTKEYTYEIFYK